MRRNIKVVVLGLAFLFGGAITSSAEVKQVQMQVSGYLCNF